MKQQGSLIFYISNGVVKIGLTTKEKKVVPHIVATEISELSYNDFENREKLENAIYSKLDDLCLSFKKNHLSKPHCAGIAIKDICIVFSTPWYTSQTKNIHVEEKKPFIVSDQLIKQYVEEASKPYTTGEVKEYEIIEQKLIKIALNGYATTDPFKKKATSMDLSVFLSFAKKSSIEKIKETIEKHFNLRAIHIHSQSLASFTVTQGILKNISNYVIADITSEITELLIIRQNTLSETASFPLGKLFVIREISKKLNTTYEVAASLIRLHQEQKLDPIMLEKITIVLIEIQKVWLISFTKALSDMSVGSSLPSKFYLLAPNDVTWLFSDFIKAEEYQQFSFSEGKFEVYDVKVADIEKFCTFGLDTLKDLSIAIGAVYNFNL